MTKMSYTQNQSIITVDIIFNNNYKPKTYYG